jgi:C-terminal processing protease CtpA/Prc
MRGRFLFDAIRHVLCCVLFMTLLPTQSAHAQVATAQSDKYTRDFASAWTFVRDQYAYFDAKKTDWNRVRESLEPRARAARTDAEFIGVLEIMLEQLYDHHAHLGVNTATSPRLVPSGADVWAEHRQGRAYVTAVRAGSSAQRAGLRAGMEIVSIGGRAVDQVVAARRPTTLRDPDVRADDWALRVELAGRQNASVALEVLDGARKRRVTIEPGGGNAARDPLGFKRLANNVGYVVVNNSLGDDGLIAAWDAALETLRHSDGMILDLRDTPSGGNSTVARGLMGRLVSEARPYQRHELPAEERESGVKRIWVEYVAPRGAFAYDKPVVVLVGHWTGSMGEGIAIGLDGMQRASIFGTPMAGLLGATYSEKLPLTGIEVRVPAERLYHVDGTPREAFVPRAAASLEGADDKLLVAARELLKVR